MGCFALYIGLLVYSTLPSPSPKSQRGLNSCQPPAWNFAWGTSDPKHPKSKGFAELFETTLYLYFVNCSIPVTLSCWEVITTFALPCLWIFFSINSCFLCILLNCISMYHVRMISRSGIPGWRWLLRFLRRVSKLLWEQLVPISTPRWKTFDFVNFMLYFYSCKTKNCVHFIVNGPICESTYKQTRITLEPMCFLNSNSY